MTIPKPKKGERPAADSKAGREGEGNVLMARLDWVGVMARLREEARKNEEEPRPVEGFL